MYFESRSINREEKGHFLVMKESIQNTYIANLNLYAPNNAFSKICKGRADRTKRENRQIYNQIGD